MARPDGPRRIQVLDEAWALLGSERTSKYLQACWKLSRAYGVANLAIIHRLSDLRAQADDGHGGIESVDGAARRHPDPDPDAPVDRPGRRRHATCSGLTTTEAALLPRLVRGSGVVEDRQPPPPSSRPMSSPPSRTPLLRHRCSGWPTRDPELTLVGPRDQPRTAWGVGGDLAIQSRRSSLITRPSVASAAGSCGPAPSSPP